MVLPKFLIIEVGLCKSATFWLRVSMYVHVGLGESWEYNSFISGIEGIYPPNILIYPFAVIGVERQAHNLIGDHRSAPKTGDFSAFMGRLIKMNRHRARAVRMQGEAKFAVLYSTNGVKVLQALKIVHCQAARPI